MTTATRYQMPSADGTFEKTAIERRDLGPLDVQIEIKYAGICHSDIHTARNEWGNTAYPVVPGHEIAGIVTAVGDEVTRHEVGDRVGVGCFVDSCGACEACGKGEEQYCAKGVVQTYNYPVGEEYTKGGYSTQIVVTEHFVVSIPDELGLDVAAPLLCCGITLYSPRRHWKVGEGLSGRDRRDGRTRPHRRETRPRDGGAGHGAQSDSQQAAGRQSSSGPTTTTRPQTRRRSTASRAALT
jgi:alcohol dehydrogenase (NADP+)